MITRRKYIEALSLPDFFVRSGVFRMFTDDRDPGSEVTSAAIADTTPDLTRNLNPLRMLHIKRL